MGVEVASSGEQVAPNPADSEVPAQLLAYSAVSLGLCVPFKQLCVV